MLFIYVWLAVGFVGRPTPSVAIACSRASLEVAAAAGVGGVGASCSRTCFAAAWVLDYYTCGATFVVKLNQPTTAGPNEVLSWNSDARYSEKTRVCATVVGAWRGGWNFARAVSSTDFGRPRSLAVILASVGRCLISGVCRSQTSSEESLHAGLMSFLILDCSTGVPMSGVTYSGSLNSVVSVADAAVAGELVTVECWSLARGREAWFEIESTSYSGALRRQVF